MTLDISPWERQYLRSLAVRQCEYAALPVMRERERQWTAINTGARAPAPVVVETDTFDDEFLPRTLLRCSSEAAVQIEMHLLRTLRNHEHLDDDKVVPAVYPVSHPTVIDDFGFNIKQVHASDSLGRTIGFRHEHPLADLDASISLLKPATISCDRSVGDAWHDFVSDVLGDILPVQFEDRPPMIDLTEKVIRLMGMDHFYTALYDSPDQVHELMQMLCDNQVRIMKFHEDEGLLNLNNGNQHTGASSFGYTTELPQPGFIGKVRLRDLWLWAELEETVGLSPAMFREFCLPYMAEACGHLGLIYYGCCEPVHLVWESLIAQIPNIRKVSISPWCDQIQMGDYLRQTSIVFSRKPSPLYLGVATVLDEKAWSAHIRETLDAAKGCACEIIMRDNYKVGSLDRVRRAVELARNEAWRT